MMEYHTKMMQIIKQKMYTLHRESKRFFRPEEAISAMDNDEREELRRIEATFNIILWELNIKKIEKFNSEDSGQKIDLMNGSINFTNFQNSSQTKSKLNVLDLEYQEENNESKGSVNLLDIRASKREIIHNMAYGLEKMFQRVFRINHHAVNPPNNSCTEYHLQKLVHWLVFLGFENELKDWMLLYNISPFRPSKMGMNGLHLLCKYQLQESSPLRKF